MDLNLQDSNRNRKIFLWVRVRWFAVQAADPTRNGLIQSREKDQNKNSFSNPMNECIKKIKHKLWLRVRMIQVIRRAQEEEDRLKAVMGFEIFVTRGAFDRKLNWFIDRRVWKFNKRALRFLVNSLQDGVKHSQTNGFMDVPAYNSSHFLLPFSVVYRITSILPTLSRKLDSQQHSYDAWTRRSSSTRNFLKKR